ncbi:MAG: cellulase family glycosylhydrolase [Clostridia bacterium]|nr:cellulase family glycosylhydrolase [Clostridia bacterium]
MKTAKRLLSVFIAFIMVLSVCPAIYAGDAQPKESAAFTDDDFLTAKGRDIVNKKGEKVVLKGVNLGAWLIWEDWINNYEEVSDCFEAYETLVERFGEEKAYALIHKYEDNFITEYDLDNIKSLGFNCVRVPFWFRNFYYDDGGRKILDENGEWDFSRLDWIVDECSERGIYVVLDMHGAVGYQSDAPHSGKTKSVGLYDKTEQGEQYRKWTNELWTAIATRFKGNPAVAMYDLLNEPMCDCDCTEIRRRINNEYIYDILYKTVRAVDEDHLITVECIWTPLAVPHAFTKGWKNMVYQVHFYQNSDFIFNLFVYLTRIYFADVPMLMGEFYPLGTTTWANCLKTLNNCNFSWLLWTYKATGHLMWESDWCIEGSKDGFERAKLKTDSYEEIARKWGEDIRTENGFQDSGHYSRDVKDFI